MSKSVKPRRRYESPRRREQAAATRQAILETAERLFAKRGYVGTSVAEIAKEAGVALKKPSTRLWHQGGGTARALEPAHAGR